MAAQRVVRSHLYVPADRPALFAKALASGADAVILDLEDAVPVPAKPAAREAVAQLCAVPVEGPEVWVRVNAEYWADDLSAVLGPGVSGICLAKTAGADAVRRAAELVSRLEAERDLQPGAVRFSPLLEDAGAVLAAREIAAAPRVTRLQVGEADLAADCRITPGPDGAELAWVRAHVVLVSAAAGLEAPVAPVTTDFTDLDALRHQTGRLRDMGYGSRACIHPAQVAVVNEVFTPSAQEVERAAATVARFRRAETDGSGVVVGPDGRMVDLAVVRNAERVLAAAAADG